MPTDPAILGFSNPWYPAALQNAQRVRIGNYEIRLITAPFSCHKSRGIFTDAEKAITEQAMIWRTSSQLSADVLNSPTRSALLRWTCRNILGNEFGALLSNPHFIDALPGDPLFDTASQQRAALSSDE